jgi:hypothetical protein
MSGTGAPVLMGDRVVPSNEKRLGVRVAVVVPLVWAWKWYAHTPPGINVLAGSFGSVAKVTVCPFAVRLILDPAMRLNVGVKVRVPTGRFAPELVGTFVP